MEPLNTSSRSPLRIAITPGEPAGIGPELAVMLAQQPQADELVVFADPDLLLQRAKLLKLPLQLREYAPGEKPKALSPGELCVSPSQLDIESCPGKLNPANAHYVIDTLQAASRECLAKRCEALVTAPIHKGVINDAGIRLHNATFSGHTEFLAAQSNTSRVVMMLATAGLRVALATTHLPLREVADAINPVLLEEVITILYRDLQSKFAIAAPSILIAGLNPHAGEGGHLGREEIDIIEPVLEKLRSRGWQLKGPLPADTLFTDQHLQHADAVLAMYHDQGLPVLKYKGFGKAVNITLGLPFIRTSVDHGTALDLAGSGQADCGSLFTALDYAIDMVLKQRVALKQRGSQ